MSAAGDGPLASVTVPVTADGATLRGEDRRRAPGATRRALRTAGDPGRRGLRRERRSAVPRTGRDRSRGSRAPGRPPWSCPRASRRRRRRPSGVLYDRLYDLGVGRDDTVVALGGGVIGDLAGYAAATFLRGVCLVQAPTTLLAMVDAAVGGKVAVDFREGKNYLGTFYQPRLVVEDPDTLATLPEREVRGGWAEVVKHGLLAGGVTLALTEAGAAHPTRPDPRLLEADVRFKAAIVAARPARDDGRPRGAQLRPHGRSRDRGGRRLCPLLARRGRGPGPARRAVALRASARASTPARPARGQDAAVGRGPARAADRRRRRRRGAPDRPRQEGRRRRGQVRVARGDRRARHRSRRAARSCKARWSHG